MTTAAVGARQGKREAPAAAVPLSTVLLMPQEDRIAHRSLGRWAADLLARLACARRQREVREFCGEVSGVANNAALIAVHRGDPSTARRLCEGQYCWQGRYARRAHDPAIAMNAVQPWTNLGRLDAASGDWRSALARFDAVGGPSSAGPRLPIGALHVSREDWRTIAPTRHAFDCVRLMIYVTDSLKALLLSRRWSAAEAFASTVALPVQDPLAVHVEEAVIVAIALSGDHAEACRRAAAARQLARGWVRVVFQIRQAEAHACAGSTGRARALVEPLAATLAELSPSTVRQSQTLHVLGRVSSLCLHLGLDRAGAILGRRVYEGAQAADDEAYQIESLRVLAEADTSDARHRWRATLAALEEETEYARYRRDRRPAAASVNVSALLDTLRGIFAGGG